MSSKQDELEKKLDSIEREQSSLKTIISKIEQAEETKRIIKDQQGSPLKYLVDILKILLAIVVISSGSRIAEQPWVSELIK
jgi:prefoldin subunit 5